MKTIDTTTKKKRLDPDATRKALGAKTGIPIRNFWHALRIFQHRHKS